MISSLFLVAFLVYGSPLVPPAQDSSSTLDREFDDLEKKFSDRAMEWSLTVHRSLTPKQKAPKQPVRTWEGDPSIELFPRFQELADRGSGRALLWTGLYIHAAALPEEAPLIDPFWQNELVRSFTLVPRRPMALWNGRLPEHRAVMQREILEGVAERHAEAPWASFLCSDLKYLWKNIGLEHAAAIALEVEERGATEEIQSSALRSRAELYQVAWESDGDEDLRAEALALFEDLVERYPDSPFAFETKCQIAQLSTILPGKPAPRITGTDLAGAAFDLEDYRGKVVVLDFWAFW